MRARRALLSAVSVPGGAPRASPGPGHFLAAVGQQQQLGPATLHLNVTTVSGLRGPVIAAVMPSDNNTSHPVYRVMCVPCFVS